MAQLQPWVRANAHALRAVDLHDWLVYAYCRTQGLRWYIDPVPSMHYRQHASNQVGINAGLSAYRKRWALLRSHWSRRQVLAIGTPGGTAAGGMLAAALVFDPQLLPAAPPSPRCLAAAGPAAAGHLLKTWPLVLLAPWQPAEKCQLVVHQQIKDKADDQGPNVAQKLV